MLHPEHSIISPHVAPRGIIIFPATVGMAYNQTLWRAYSEVRSAQQKEGGLRVSIQHHCNP